MATSLSDEGTTGMAPAVIPFRPGPPPAERRGPALTRKWTRAALAAHRSAFEEEMRRQRRALDPELERYWRRQRAQEA